jgi:hypothetical protein
LFRPRYRSRRTFAGWGVRSAVRHVSRAAGTEARGEPAPPRLLPRFPPCGHRQQVSCVPGVCALVDRRLRTQRHDRLNSPRDQSRRSCLLLSFPRHGGPTFPQNVAKRGSFLQRRMEGSRRRLGGSLWKCLYARFQLFFCDAQQLPPVTAAANARSLVAVAIG